MESYRLGLLALEFLTDRKLTTGLGGICGLDGFIALGNVEQTRSVNA
jgi:hypothetical protein